MLSCCRQAHWEPIALATCPPKKTLSRNMTLSIHRAAWRGEGKRRRGREGGRTERVPDLHDVTNPKISVTKKDSSLCTTVNSGFHLPRSHVTAATPPESQRCLQASVDSGVNVSPTTLGVFSVGELRATQHTSWI